MGKKALIIASVASMIDQFSMSNINILQKKGYEVHVAANFEKGNTCPLARVKEFKKELDLIEVSYYQIDFSRSIVNLISNYNAFKQLLKLLKENDYDFVHCQSPIGGVLGRIAAHRTKTKVIYTAHGFHFFAGAPIINWLIYYPVERYLSRFTDILITTNNEDFKISNKFKARKNIYIPGVGIDTTKFSNTGIESKFKEDLQLNDVDIVILSIGELIKRKNHQIVLKALSKLENTNYKYLICGQGEKESSLRELSKELGIEKKVEFLGFIDNLVDVYSVSDLFVHPSLQEGLPVALMQAMAAGLPVVCSNIRGNNDLITDGVGGYLFELNDVDGLIRSIRQAIENREVLSKNNLETIKNFDTKYVNERMQQIYEQIASSK